ncbi:Tetratricopeptide repeat-containing protein [Mariniphaga anaerophila]|uniref:Tetratricopeptide repeat-containing protein n=1 Tax=Mariniphaga anaerophila TaxID=1484053 RepID=A0A1M5BTI2_9BACT|nr:tetratricopeptide repeat protein [Mariniphaga anaerophila]SHF45641.1 Tetratricopeptide repeat-containing protein [Mariniphaga anaerophila]
MEFLKIKAVFLILFLSTSSAWSQTAQEALEKAFAQSYKLEKEKDFLASANELETVYDQSSYEINLRLGWLYYNAGQFDKSITFYSTAQKLKPYSEEARFGLILPLAAQGKWDEVIAIYNKILEINQNNTVAMYRLGLIYYQHKSYDKSLPLFKKVVDLYPFHYDGLLMLAWTSYFTGNYTQATVLFNKVKLYNPGDASANEGLQLMRVKK